MKKVLIISYYWPPSGGAGVQRWLKFTKYLPGFGIKPFVLTVDPAYAAYPQIDKSLEKDISDEVKVFRTRSFEVLNIFGRLFGKDKLPYGGFSNVSTKGFFPALFRFLRGNFFLPDARKGWNRYAFKKAEELIATNGIKTVITTGPPHSTHLVGLKIKKEMSVRWIADFRDPWTDIYYYSDLLHTPFAKRADLKTERRVLENADLVITNCDSNRDLLVSKVDSNLNNKFTVITNGYDEEDFAIEAGLPHEFVITYTGTMSEHYKPGSFFKALSELIINHPEIKVSFRVAGIISPAIESEIRMYGLSDNYEYAGYVDHARLVELLSGSSALLYVFPQAAEERGIAGKLFEYIASRRPVIAIGSTKSDASSVIAECDAGRCFTRNESEKVLDYLEELVMEFRKSGEVKAGNGKHTVYSRKNLASKLSKLIEA